MDTRLFPLRNEELSVIGRFIYTSFVRDVSAFVPYSSFDAPFPANFLAKVEAVEAAIAPQSILSQMKLVTFNMLTDMYSIREKVNQAEIWFKSAGAALNIAPNDMGQRAVRKAINRGDVEQAVAKLRLMNANIAIAANSTALIAVGFTLPKQTALVTATTSINTANNTQNTLYEQWTDLAGTNMTLYNSFWSTFVSPTASSGKLIYRLSNKTKAKDYTVSVLKKRIRQDQLQTEIFGVITNAGRAVNGAKVKLIPVDGGRTKTVYTDADGKYRVNGMRPVDYNAVVTKDALVKVVQVTAVTREHVELNVALG